MGDNAYTGQVARRVGMLERERCNVDEPNAGYRTPVASGGGGYLLKITGLHSDSPASGVRMYTGSIYGNGSAAVATQSNVTVRIPGIAADVTAPSYGAWADVPYCGALLTTATWTGATQTHTNDTVYEAIGLLLLV